MNKISVESTYMVMSEEITEFESTETEFQDKRVLSWSAFKKKKTNCMVPLGANFVTCKILFFSLPDWTRHLTRD